MFDWKKLNADVIREFRSNGGKVARFGELPVAILHTIGARSGCLREVPLIVVIDEGESLLFGTAGGAPVDPLWVANLRAHPRIEIELGQERFTADIQELTGDEARAKIETQARAVPQFVAYMESAAPRTIPVFRIDRV